MNFSKRLKELREKKGLSQEQLADRLNIPRSSMTNYESGDDERIPRPKRLESIAEFFGVSVDYLLGRAETTEFSHAEKDLLADIDKLSIEELIEKHVLTVDGKLATRQEIEAAISFIRLLRNQK